MEEYNKLLAYDIFIFDFDGIIIDSEKIHNLCWNKVLKKYNVEIDYYNYCKIFHTNENDGIKKNLEKYYNINNFDELCNKKNILYHEYVLNNDMKLIDGIDVFLDFLNKYNKNIIIATNTNKNNVEYVFNKYLNNIKLTDIFSRELIKNKKPNPEIYNIIYNKYGNKKYLIFEDSLSGITSVNKSLLNNLNNNLFFLNKFDYYHYNFIINNYNSIHIIKYDLQNINNKLISLNQHQI
jgi:beta-phosphoglucomutase